MLYSHAWEMKSEKGLTFHISETNSIPKIDYSGNACNKYLVIHKGGRA